MGLDLRRPARPSPSPSGSADWGACLPCLSLSLSLSLCADVRNVVFLRRSQRWHNWEMDWLIADGVLFPFFSFFSFSHLRCGLTSDEVMDGGWMDGRMAAKNRAPRDRQTRADSQTPGVTRTRRCSEYAGWSRHHGRDRGCTIVCICPNSQPASQPARRGDMHGHVLGCIQTDRHRSVAHSLQPTAKHIFFEASATPKHPAKKKNKTTNRTP